MGQNQLCSTMSALTFMAWETRGNRSYFYQKERHGKKVKSVYAGSGIEAVLLERCENGGRELKEIEKEKLNHEKAKDKMIDERINEFSEINQILVDALFLINGFYQHKRQWRKKRK